MARQAPTTVGDGAAALVRPKDGSGIDAAAADDTAARREANRTVEANAVIIIEPESTTEFRSKLLGSTAGRVVGQHGVGKRPPLSFIARRARCPTGQVHLGHLRLQAGVRGLDGPTPAHPTFAFALLGLKRAVGATLEARAKAAGIASRCCRGTCTHQ